MTIDDQSDLVMLRLDALARDLIDRGLSPDLIVAVAMGWSIGAAVLAHGPERTRGHLRHAAGAVTLHTSPMAGRA